MLLMCGVYITYAISGFSFLLPILALITLLVFALCLSHAKFYPKIVGSFMFVTGILILVKTKKNVLDIFEGIITNVPLITMLMLVLLISIPIKLGKYFNHIYYLLKILSKKDKTLFSIVSFSVFTLGTILHLGSIKILQELIEDLELKPNLIARAYGVGFTTVALWSPYFGSVALAIYLLEISISQYIVISLPLSLLVLFIGILILKPEKQRKVEEYKLISDPYIVREEVKGIFKLVYLIALLLLTVLFIDFVTSWSMLFIISIVSIVFPIVWLIINKKMRELKGIFKEYKDKSINNMNNEVVMFISAGLFANASTNTSLADNINTFMELIANTSFLLFVVTLLGIMMILTFIGLHPIVFVSILGSQVNPANLNIAPEVIALLFMIGWSMSALISPANPLNMVISNAVKCSSLQVGLRFNGLYVIVMFVELSP